MALRPLRSLLMAGALLPTTILAQSKPDATPDGDKSLPQKIQERLAAQGFTDVHVVPTSYLVSAKDKDGNPIMILIGPDSMTMLTMDKSSLPKGNDPSIAESPKAGDKDIDKEIKL